MITECAYGQLKGRRFWQEKQVGFGGKSKQLMKNKINNSNMYLIF